MQHQFKVTEHKEIILLTIYAKSKQENIMPSRIEGKFYSTKNQHIPNFME
ncbi:hypothetical protein [Clostridium kluyveri]|nr:hypothetical protein [Clostridium kluyveri]UZQ52062.1 hypothetical protein OP486_07875 [Clostridium kluyveri]